MFAPQFPIFATQAPCLLPTPLILLFNSPFVRLNPPLVRLTPHVCCLIPIGGEALISMGFDQKDAAMALYQTWEDADKMGQKDRFYELKESQILIHTISYPYLYIYIIFELLFGIPQKR
jgi:hypothetical protein